MVAFLIYTWRHMSISRITIAVTFLYCIYIIQPNILPRVQAISASGASRSLTGNGNPNPRLPRTSASQLNSGNSATNNLKISTKSFNTTRNGNLRSREQQLLNIFEIIIATLEDKLKRVDKLDKNVDLMMQHIDTLESRLANNIANTEFIISKLNNIESILTNGFHEIKDPKLDNISQSRNSAQNSTNNMLNDQIIQLHKKVINIDSKLEGLKSQIDNNFLQVEDINGEASEKKPVTMHANEITKALNFEAMTHVSSELSELRDSTDSIDKKLQFHINIVSENIGRMMRMMHDIHFAVVDQVNTLNVTTNDQSRLQSGRADDFNEKPRPMVSISTKMSDVWDVVAGAKSTVDHLLPKTEALLTQTQRQERAIDQIHQDLKTKTNLIINNLDMVEKHLKKQESDAQTLPIPPGAPDHFTDTATEYGSSNYSGINTNLTGDNSVSLTSLDSIQPRLMTTIATIILANKSHTEDTLPTHSQTVIDNITQGMTNESPFATPAKIIIRKGGIIFPSIKNKPSIVNNTVNSDILGLKDIKGFSCVDLLNAGMKHSGVYYLQIRGTTYWFLKVYCEQETSEGGWTVIQRREDFGEPRENFNRDWADYKNGFGEPAKEFWLGNENIYMLTNNEEYTLRVDLEDFEGNIRYAQYSHFKIHSEADYYKLEIDGYEGNAGDSLNDPWYGSNNSPFSTYNKDNDRSSLNCASMLKGGWWWKSCGRGLNGLYLHDPQDLTARQGIVWFRWRGWDYTLKKSTMMIRPKIPQPQSMFGSFI
ncbi:hypothetical protein KR009_003404 [Drosophila setifemur]|nr:hypothetical protein KR009_003404 [Drosophila setifemur]